MRNALELITTKSVVANGTGAKNLTVKMMLTSFDMNFEDLIVNVLCLCLCACLWQVLGLG